MKFGKRYTRKTVFMAMINGVLIGIAAIALIGIIIYGANGNKALNSADKEVPATGPPPEAAVTPSDVPVDALKLFAVQHGAFSSSASAATFIAADPFLSTAAIIKVGDQYFVWSAVGLTEAEIAASDSEETFEKQFNANPAACEVVGAKMLREVLATDDLAKIKSLETENDGDEVAEFNRHIVDITSFTSDLKVIRLHLLAHYSTTVGCIEITF